jgi:ubiquinone biosynthesis monooxygenase Coq7
MRLGGIIRELCLIPTSIAMPHLTPAFVDCCIEHFDLALRSVVGVPIAVAIHPKVNFPQNARALEAWERAVSVALMRVDHVGEVCAQALYQAQALSSSSPSLKQHLHQAALEEQQHLNWTAMRLKELQGRPSCLNPLWYCGAFTLGLVAGRLGDRTSLGFVTETERQVEAHLDEHLQRLPESDQRSRAILMRMREDEIRHGAEAEAAGGQPIPAVLGWAMQVMGRIMTRAAEKI